MTGAEKLYKPNNNKGRVALKYLVP